MRPCSGPFYREGKNRAIIAPKRAPTGLKTAHNATKTNSDLRMPAFGGKADMIRDVAKSPLEAKSGHWNLRKKMEIRLDIER